PDRTCVESLEEELAPGAPPVAGVRDDRAVVEALDAVPMAQRVRRLGVLVLDADLGRPPGVIRLHRAQVGERLPGAVLDQLPRPRGRDHPRARLAEAALDRHGRQALAEQRLSLPA